MRQALAVVKDGKGMFAIQQGFAAQVAFFPMSNPPSQLQTQPDRNRQLKLKDLHMQRSSAQDALRLN